MKVVKAWATATRDGFLDAQAEYGIPLWETVEEAEGRGPMQQTVLAMTWAREPGQR